MRNREATLSVVIPAWNEAAELPETVRRARLVPEVCEILVVDGESTDATLQVGGELGCRVLRSPRGRGAQMRLGAEAASGEVILLLHADTWLAPEAGRAIFHCLQDDAVVGGGFWKRFRERRFFMLGSRLRCAVHFYGAGLILGDQGLFVRREVLEAVGGVPDMPIMEEFELCRRLRKVGRLALANSTVVTSARRFLRGGVWRTYWLMGRITALYFLGVPVKQLHKLYERRRG